ncbi:hypothetical protein ACLKA7_006093 [Drosophila subpalustris]
MLRLTLIIIMAGTCHMPSSLRGQQHILWPTDVDHIWVWHHEDRLTGDQAISNITSRSVIGRSALRLALRRSVDFSPECVEITMPTAYNGPEASNCDVVDGDGDGDGVECQHQQQHPIHKFQLETNAKANQTKAKQTLQRVDAAAAIEQASNIDHRQSAGILESCRCGSFEPWALVLALVGPSLNEDWRRSSSSSRESTNRQQQQQQRQQHELS